MSRSLQRRLTLLLGGAVVLAAMLAGLAAFVLAYREATEFQDDLLRQIAVLTQGEAPRHGNSNEPNRPALSDPDSRITLVRLPEDPRPAWLPERPAPGFHQWVDDADDTQRVFVRQDTQAGETIVVAQPTETRDEIALGSALQSLLPLLLLLPVIAWLILRIVRQELAPISELAKHLDAQPADRPAPLSSPDVPDEIRPFVAAINRLLERVGDLVQQQRRFIADAAHEIRSPLTALSVQAQNLEQAPTLEAARERTRPLRAGIERARKLTEQLLSLARIQASAESAEEIDIAELARELIGEQLSFAEDQGIDLGLEQQAAPRLTASADSLRLVLRNGLENALKYGHPGSEVTLRISEDAESVLIEVLDKGPGIPEAERAQVLEPFYRLHPGKEGSGLGLSIASEAARRMGGVLELDSRAEGPGLIFRLRLPIRARSDRPSDT